MLSGMSQSLPVACFDGSRKGSKEAPDDERSPRARMTRVGCNPGRGGHVLSAPVLHHTVSRIADQHASEDRSSATNTCSRDPWNCLLTVAVTVSFYGDAGCLMHYVHSKHQAVQQLGALLPLTASFEVFNPAILRQRCNFVVDDCPKVETCNVVGHVSKQGRDTQSFFHIDTVLQCYYKLAQDRAGNSQRLGINSGPQSVKKVRQDDTGILMSEQLLVSRRSSHDMKSLGFRISGLAPQ